jgi:manganese transport protein
VPNIVHSDVLLYFYFAVGIIAATMMPYEVYFYSSGGIEEKWKPGDLIVNKINAIVGFLLGGLLVAGIIVVSAHFFQPLQISPQFISTTALNTLIPFGQAGVLLALLGMLFSIGGSAIETCFAGAYNLSQYMGWNWGKNKHPVNVPRFTRSWMAFLVGAFLIIICDCHATDLLAYFARRQRS